jgi:hypothetical protein
VQKRAIEYRFGYLGQNYNPALYSLLLPPDFFRLYDVVIFFATAIIPAIYNVLTYSLLLIEWGDA